MYSFYTFFENHFFPGQTPVPPRSGTWILDLSCDPIWAIWLAEVRKFHQHHDRIFTNCSSWGGISTVLHEVVNQLTILHEVVYQLTDLRAVEYQLTVLHEVEYQLTVLHEVGYLLSFMRWNINCSSWGGKSTAIHGVGYLLTVLHEVEYQLFFMKWYIN